jgi:hypothetical protein
MSHCELQAGDDLLALRSQIGRLAVICNVDVSHDDTVRRLLAGDYGHCHHHDREAELLRALLVLLYRLEASVSEDLGIQGLVALWKQHSEVLVRHGFTADSQPALNGSAP